VRGKGSKLGEGERDKLGEPYPKVRLSQDRLPMEPFLHMKSQVWGKGSKLGEGKRD
jgi:hypothetical protein